MYSLNVTLCVGFPIRKSPDRSLFAAPRGLSQLVTSFIGSWCQGIRPVLFIAWTSPVRFAWVIVDNRLNCQTPQWNYHCFFHLLRWNCSFPNFTEKPVSLQILAYIFQHMLTICSFYSSFVLFSFQWPQFLVFSHLVGSSGLEPPTSRLSGARSNHLSYEPICLAVYPLLHLFAFGGDDGIRTHDPLLAGQVLSQLSYTPILHPSDAWVVFFFWRQSFKIEQQEISKPKTL